MGIKKTVNRIGKLFIALKQEDEKMIRQSTLVVDNGYTWLGHLESAIERIVNDFPKAKISVLTFEQRKNILQKSFPQLSFILPSQRLKPKRYLLALQMLKLRRDKFNFIFLFSLDITTLITSLIFLRTERVILYNQWGQWWQLRLRKVNEIFKSTYVKKKTKICIKNFLKSIGLLFILVQRKDEEALRHSILVVDNGYAQFNQFAYTIQMIKDSLPGANLSVLALEQRMALKDKFPDLDIIKPAACIIERYCIARHMIRLRKNRYDYIILLSLDVTPIIASIVFMNGKVILNNKWHQWWLIKPRSIRGYLMVVPQFIFNIIIFIFLLISVAWIFLKRSFNIFKFSLFKRHT